ncbi:MAG: nucleotidyltransferase domain-containing protein [Cyanobacteria bacterium J06576_12]
MTHPKLQEILSRLQTYLESVYADRLVSLVLFGSQARKEATDDSDIDLLIVLAGRLDVPRERALLSEVLADICLEYEVLITCLWAERKEWKTQQSPLMLNILREGIAV